MKAVEELEGEYDARIGVALSRPGAEVDADGEAVGDLGPDLTGELDVDYAWSTAKVPIAVAYQRATGEVDETVEAALTVSDNDAAAAMWDSLGGGMASRDAVDEVLADAGDHHTHMQTTEDGVYNGIFGMTDWTVAGQSVMGANLLCIDGGPEVYEVMGQIAEDQSYGLGRVDGAHFKGGWAPDPETGEYLVRQLGVVPAFGNDGDAADGAFAGVAVAVEPEDGTYQTGMDVLDELAEVIAEHPPLGGECPQGGSRDDGASGGEGSGESAAPSGDGNASAGESADAGEPARDGGSGGDEPAGESAAPSRDGRRDDAGE
ncbi:hypothetical protein [Corynebacterium sp. 335C]